MTEKLEDGWTVTKRIDTIRAGDRIVFTHEMGGEGEILTARGGANNMLGTWTLGTEELDFDLEFYGLQFVPMAPEVDRLKTPGKTYDHEPYPDDMPEPGDRCKTCGEDITWIGPGMYDYLHVDDKENR